MSVSQGFGVGPGYFDPPLTQILPAAENREEEKGVGRLVGKQNRKGRAKESIPHKGG